VVPAITKPIAGANRTLTEEARIAVERGSSAIPLATLPSRFPVAGATTIRSDSRLVWIWRIEASPSSRPHSMYGPPVSWVKRSTVTGFPESVPRVRGVMKRVAEGVITMWTSIPILRNRRMISAAL
jgi:hypothetical protein